MTLPGTGAAETPSGADLAEDAAGTPPEGADELLDEDSGAPPEDDEEIEGDEPDEGEEGTEPVQDPREELLASLTPEQRREFKRLENDSARLGRFARQNKIMARRLEALEARIEGGTKAKEEEPDPRISSIEQEIAQLGPQIKAIHASWNESYKELGEANEKLSILRGKLKEAGDDEFAKSQVEARVDSMEAKVRALRLECQSYQERFKSASERVKELQESKPKAEREAKDERARREQERERQAKQLRAFPGQVEAMVHTATVEAGIPISRKSEAGRYGHFVDGVKARVANFLVARGQTGKPMATMKQIELAVRKAVEIEAIVIGSKRVEPKPATTKTTLKEVPRPQLKQAAPKAGTEKLSPQQQYEAFKAGVARRAKLLG